MSKKEEIFLLNQCLTDANYVFAKTMPDIPHSYSHIRTWKNKKDFYFCVQAIRDYGYEESFDGYKYTYYHFDNYKYWTMGNAINETILINKTEDIGK